MAGGENHELDDKNARIAELEQQLQQLSHIKGGPAFKSDLQGRQRGDEDTLEIRAVSVKLPPFATTNPELWFSQAECQFAIKGVKDDTTKFYHLYAALPEKVSNAVEAFLLDPPKTQKVAGLKTLLMKKYARTQLQKDTELLQIRSLGDLKPSEMLQRAMSLNKNPETLLKAILINMYPPEVKIAIANSQFATLEDMADAADKIMEAKSDSGGVNAVQADEATLEIDTIRGRGSHKWNESTGKGPTKPGTGRGQTNRKTCFYHDRHGPAAFRCDGEPCPWATTPLAKKPGNGTAGRQ